MKKHFFENKRIKLIARVVLLVLLLASALTLTACPGNNSRQASPRLYSYDEAIEYATSHKQQFESDDCIFFMFDLDKYESISLEHYVIKTEWFASGWDLFKPSSKCEIPDDHLKCENISRFTMSKALENGDIVEDAYIIECCDYYPIEYEFQENPLDIIKSNINFIDSINSEQYVSKYYIFIDEYIGIKITITHKDKATQEELDAIVQIFIDNAVIIK